MERLADISCNSGDRVCTSDRDSLRVSIWDVRAGNSFGTISRDPDFESDFNSQLLPIVRTIMSVKAMSGCKRSCARRVAPEEMVASCSKREVARVEMAVSMWHMRYV